MNSTEKKLLIALSLGAPATISQYRDDALRKSGPVYGNTYREYERKWKEEQANG